MFRSISVCSLAFAAICASTVLASAQVTSSPTDTTGASQSSTAPVAYIYVSNYTTNSTSQINAYSAATDGSLTPIVGSPFQYNVSYMALNGKWLFGIANLDTEIDSFSIGSNGALTQKDAYVVSTNGDGVISDYLDHTGSTLYADYYTTNNDYLSYSINQSTGMLTQTGDLAGGPANNSPVRFIGNNEFAYSSSCYHFGQEIIGVKRNTDGTLSYISNFNPPFPAEKSGGFYCPWLAAADPNNNLAIAMEPLNSNWGQDGNWQLAVYTADASGNLTTNSTYSNMPSVGIGSVNDYSMSPSGKYLAVGGTTGLQIFHFNGPNPIKKYTGPLTNVYINQIFWDNSNHVYAISYEAGKLFVWTVTSTSVTRAPGSPYKITQPGSLIVLPK
jgi:hypothetical protein